MRRTPTSSALLFFLLLVTAAARAQSPTPAGPTLIPFSPGPQLVSPLTQPSLSPGVLHLLELEARFAADVAKGGGTAFASWFADDAVTLNNGKPAVLGHRAIAETAVWDPKTYHLTWSPEGAQMGPSGDTGFTWGHYDATGVDRNGQPLTSSGRYITFWKRLPPDPAHPEQSKTPVWKVALDASAQDAPAPGDCCALPKP